MYRCCPEMPAIRRVLETGEPGRPVGRGNSEKVRGKK